LRSKGGGNAPFLQFHNMIYNSNMNKKGFTLIEMLIAVALLGILSSIAVPIYRGYQRTAMRQEATANLSGLRMCLEEYYAENNAYAPGAGPYTWSNNGGTDTITNWLPCFNPRNAAGGVQNKFDYSLSRPSATTYDATATGRAGFAVSGDVFTIDELGVKTGPWPQ